MAKKHILQLSFWLFKSLSQRKKNLNQKTPIFHFHLICKNFICQQKPPPTHLRHPKRFISSTLPFRRSVSLPSKQGKLPRRFSEGRISAETVDEKLSTLNWCQKKLVMFPSQLCWWLKQPIYEQKYAQVKLANISPSLGVEIKDL